MEKRKRPDMIIDAHQHFWSSEKFYYDWLVPELGPLYRNFVAEDLKPLVKENDVVSTVAVQARPELAETMWLLEMAKVNDFIGGVVGWVDFHAEDLDKTLDMLAKYPKLKGVRHQIEDEKDREWMIRPKTLRGLKKIEAHGLSFDALLKHDQLWQLDIVCNVCPNLPIVIDHCSKPNIAAGEKEPWVSRITAASRLPVSVKISGLLTEAGVKDWTVEKIKCYTDLVLSLFGTDRCMVGSDWPVSLQGATYKQSMDTLKELLKDLSETAKQKVFYENAKEFYRL
jgi:L-fuconolactonase